jgi:hypothetical protein
VNEKDVNEGNQIHNFIPSSGSGTLINYDSGSDFLTSYGSYGSGSTMLLLNQPLIIICSWKFFTINYWNLSELESDQFIPSALTAVWSEQEYDKLFERRKLL